MSGRLFDIDVRAEAAFSYGTDGKKAIESRIKDESESGDDIMSPLYKNYEKKIISKVTLGATKSFDYGDFKDRISLTGELYYNGKGYNKNIIKEFLNSNNRVEFAANYYEPNDYGMYYAAFFMQFDKFLNDSNKSIKFNAISNISDKSGIATAGFVYKPIDDFTIETDLNGYFGEEYSEYMLSGDRVSGEVILTLKF